VLPKLADPGATEAAIDARLALGDGHRAVSSADGMIGAEKKV
jgi:hypothetical protein